MKSVSGRRDPDRSARAAVHEIRDVEQIKALSHPLRFRVLEALAAGPPRTTKQIAETLGEPPTRLYHHVATLEGAGLVELVETRPKRGTVEKYYRAVASLFRVDPQVFDEGVGSSSRTAHGLLLRAADELSRLHPSRAAAGSSDGAKETALLVSAEVRGRRERLDDIRRRLEGLLEDLQGLSADEDAADGEEGNPAAGEEGEEESRRLLIAWYPLPSDDRSDG